MQKLLIILTLSICSLISMGQGYNADSLLQKAENYLYDNTEEAIRLSKKVIEISKQETQLFTANYTLGECYYVLGEFETSLSFYQKSQKIAERLKDEFLLSKSFVGIGTVYDDNGETERGLELYFQALKIREKLDDKKDISSVLNNIAVVYYKQDKLSKAIEYMNKCAAIDLEQGDSTGLGYSFSNLGSFHYFNNNNDSALYCHEKALKIRTALGEQFQIASTLNNMANVYEDMEEIALSFEYYQKSVEIKRKLDNPYELAKVVSNLGIAYSNHGKPREALPLLIEARQILDELNNKSLIKDNLYALAKTYNRLNQKDSAFSVLLQTYNLSKEIFNETKSEQIEEMVAKFETEKTEKENEELKAQRAIAALENEALKAKQAEDALTMEKSKTRSYLLIGSLIIVILIAVLILFLLRTNKRTTNVLQGLNNQLEEKNADITDSIQYAKRIQQALLPNKQDLSHSFNDAFVLFMPRDIVSGDFYWIHEHGDTVHFAVADCTGHGVPGAFVSVLCNNLLGQAVSEHGLTAPGEILADVNAGITNRLRKENAKVTMMDGMDISLCSLNRTTNELKFAGAMNPVLIYSENNLTEYKGTKESIGGFDHGKDYDTISQQVKKGDMIYLFSDGYQDQFGGDKGKKFKYKNLKKNLLEISQKDLTTQHEILKKKHQEWKGDLEQLDDICVMGIRV